LESAFSPLKLYEESYDSKSKIFWSTIDEYKMPLGEILEESKNKKNKIYSK
jgi:hypothetical protein